VNFKLGLELIHTLLESHGVFATDRAGDYAVHGELAEAVATECLIATLVTFSGTTLHVELFLLALFDVFGDLLESFFFLVFFIFFVELFDIDFAFEDVLDLLLHVGNTVKEVIGLILGEAWNVDIFHLREYSMGDCSRTIKSINLIIYWSKS
jgi:hypothetical protein